MHGTDLALERAKTRVGQLLNGKWQIQSILGSGGMATVFAAVHRNKKRAAIKMLHPELSLNTNIRERFLREGYVANSIDHPGVVRVDDDDVTEDGAAYIVMELLDGEPLDARADRLGGTLPLEEVAALTDQLLSVLAAAHAAGIVHRDLKPENLFLTTSGQLKVLDFGIARLREASGRSSTSIGSFMGTPSFMSPEQARGRWDEVGERSDIWAVGATMYTLLTGEPVHDAETVNEQLVLAATEAAPSLRIKRPDLPDSVVALVDRSLARNQEDRWPNARAMQEELRMVLPEAAKLGLSAPQRPIPVNVPPPSRVALGDRKTNPTDPTLVSRRGTGTATSASVPVESRGSRRKLFLAAVAAAVVALVGLGLLLRGGAERTPSGGLASGMAPTPAETSASLPPSPSVAKDPVAATPTSSAFPAGGERAPPSPPPPTSARRRARTTLPSPPKTSPQPAATKPASDPFDRRF